MHCRAYNKALMTNKDIRVAINLTESGLFAILKGRTWKHLLPMQALHDQTYESSPPQFFKSTT